jgi:pantoate kinase
MTAVLGRGTCGGHVTLLFTVEDIDEDPIKQGSLGAGLCLNDGAEAIARGELGDYSLEVKLLDGNGDSKMFQQVLDLLSEEISAISDYSWEIAIRNKLPSSQGFGMSAAGAIAAASAFQRSLGLPHEESFRRSLAIAHMVERQNSTGLGDVTALAAGGVERRLSPGSPYSGANLLNGPGHSEGWTESIPVVLAWRANPGRHTSEYIDDDDWKQSITEAGRKQMDQLSDGPWDYSRWGELLNSAEAFSKQSGLSDDASRSELVEKGRNASLRAGLDSETSVLLCMLGESIAIVPRDLSKEISLENLLSELTEEGLDVTQTKVGPLS